MDANRLRFVDALEEFTDRELELLASVMHVRQYVGGEHVFRKGDRASACYIVLAGGIEVIVPGATDEGNTVATLTAGRMFGEIALVDGGLRSANCRAATGGAELCLLGRNEFDQIFNANNAFAFKLLDLIGERVVENVRRAAGELLSVVLKERSQGL
ncbi:MAG: cyclic nucleotide-binding domain-containing protein [Myxococcota bacterium]|nr:cyclic nucleotide-binding domain-containing protein [Myxococcota bacterium]